MPLPIVLMLLNSACLGSEPPPAAQVPTVVDIDVATPKAVPEPPIKERLIPYGTERQRLTMEYLRAHRGEEKITGDPAKDSQMQPKVIVLHWTAGASADGAWRTFAPDTLKGRENLKKAGAVNVSAHFLVDLDGTIYRLLPDTAVARHTIGLNHLSIGIENVGDGDRYPLTKAQIDSNAALIRHLVYQHDITHLIGHMEYRKMEGHAYFDESDPNYRTVKSDPGQDFMDAVRKEVADLALKGPEDP